MIESYRDLVPQVHPEAFVHDQAVLIGDVHIGARASIWPGTVLRGDQGAVFIGEETSIQDGSLGHATLGRSVTRVGARCTVGHRVILHGCLVDDDVLVGMGAILLDNCRIGAFSVIGAGALVPTDRVIPPRSMVMGVPGRVVREITDEEIEGWIRHGHAEYLRLCEDYLAACRARPS